MGGVAEFGASALMRPRVVGRPSQDRCRVHGRRGRNGEQDGALRRTVTVESSGRRIDAIRRQQQRCTDRRWRSPRWIPPCFSRGDDVDIDMDFRRPRRSRSLRSRSAAGAIAAAVIIACGSSSRDGFGNSTDPTGTFDDAAGSLPRQGSRLSPHAVEGGRGRRFGSARALARRKVWRGEPVRALAPCAAPGSSLRSPSSWSSPPLARSRGRRLAPAQRQRRRAWLHQAWLHQA